MSKDYRYQREEWDSVEDESFPESFYATWLKFD
mgnify:CR=1 FL=1